MDRYSEFKKRLLSLCEEEEWIKSVILIGSQCRDVCKADEYSDIDIVISCDTPEKLLYDNEWINRLGKPIYSFVEDTIAGEKERRLLFEGSLDADLIILTDENLKKALSSHMIDEIMNRGYKLFFDRSGISDHLKGINTIDDKIYTPMPESDFANLVNDFLFHTVWAEKKINRGELWTAIMCINGYLKGKLLQIIEMYERAVNGNEYDTWHCGRMLEQWADEKITNELSGCFARYDAVDLHSALNSTKKLFIELAKVCAEKYGYTTGVSEIDN